MDVSFQLIPAISVLEESAASPAWVNPELRYPIAC